jgi:hypothetical protein
MMEKLTRESRRLALLVFVLGCVACSGIAGSGGPDTPAAKQELSADKGVGDVRGRAARSAGPTTAPGSRDVGDTPPFYGYVMSAQADAILVIDTSNNTIVTKVKHDDLVRPANGKFHPNKKRFYASGVGKVTV